MIIANRADDNVIYPVETIKNKAILIGIGNWPFVDMVNVLILIERCLNLPNKYKHKWYVNHIWISRDEFHSLFTRTQISFLKKNVFAQPNNNYSKKKGVAKAYRLRKDIVIAMNNFEISKKRSNNRNISLVYRNNKPAKRLVRALPGCSEHLLGTVKPYCPINLKSLDKARQLIAQHLLYMDGRGKAPAALSSTINSLFLEARGHKRPCERVRGYTQRTIRDLNTISDLSGGAIKKGYLPQQFRQSEAGRFYATGFSLQNCTRLARNIALSGTYSFDVEACHHSILSQIAALYGWDCPNLNDYLTNKRKLRQELADHLQVSEQSAKEALIAMLYGAGEYPYRGAFFDVFGSSNKVKKAFQLPFFSGLYDELQGLFELIIVSHINDGSKVINCLGKAIYLPLEKSKLVAHLIQGIESQALTATLNAHSSAILPIHDGWICSENESVTEGEKAIFEATKFELKIEKTRISIDM